MVSIVAFQAVDPGSIPGHRRVYFSFEKPCSFFDSDNLFYFIIFP